MFNILISMSLMKNRAGLKLLQNLNKRAPVLIGQGNTKTLRPNSLKTSNDPVLIIHRPSPKGWTTTMTMAF